MVNWDDWVKGASPKILVSYLRADLTHYKLLAKHFYDKMPDGFDQQNGDTVKTILGLQPTEKGVHQLVG